MEREEYPASEPSVPVRMAPPGHSGWLDRLLDSAERASSLVANGVLMVVIVLGSLGLSLLLAVLIPPLIGWPPPDRLLLVIGIISFLVPILVGVPAVLFGDALIRRVNWMRGKLGEALAEAQLASRAKTDFLANMSHEIRTPLNGVLGMAQVLERTSLSPEQRAHLSTIRESGDLLMRVIDDVLDLARIEAGRVDLQCAAAPLGTALAATVQLFAARAAEQGTRLDFSMEPGVPQVVVHDSVRARQALANLVSNAVKFTRGGLVSVRGAADLQPDGDWLIRLTVQDNGIGIPPEAHARLFQAFAQADGSTARNHGGTGLGLAISRRLARRMGGDITLRSAPGEGSVFTFSFRAGAVPEAGPTDQAAAACAALPASVVEDDHPIAQGLRVLVVDDSRVNRKVVAGLLQPLGAVCTEAENGAVALERLAADRFDLMLLDLHMPVMDGPETLQAVRNLATPAARLPVIVLTADVMRGDRERLIALGAQGRVTKPVRRDALLAEIDRILTAAPATGTDTA